MARIQYRLSARVISGRSEVLVRFYAGKGLDQRAHTRVFAPVSLWDPENGRVVFSIRYISEEAIEASNVQSRLDQLEKDLLLRFINEPMALQSAGWLQQAVDSFNASLEEHAKSADMSAEDACLRYAEENVMESGTKAHYLVLARILQDFTKRRHQITMQTITSNDLRELQAFMSEKSKHRSHNTIASKMRKMRSVCHWARKQGITDRMPFDTYEMPSEIYGEPIVLTSDELEAIRTAVMPRPALDRQRDIFLFQCYTGQRVSDLIRMTDANIVQTPEGLVLQYIQKKTRHNNARTTVVPLASVAVNILEKYKGKQKKGQILPFINEQQYNVCIKEILRAAGVVRMVARLNTTTFAEEFVPLCDIASSHLARRTFISNIYELTQDERLTSSLSGHAQGSREIGRYIHIKAKTKRSIIDRLDNQ